MPESGLVSVIIPCYNQAQFLPEAIESASAQTYPHREIIVVDDGSTDGTTKVAADYAALQYIRQENSGVSAARNTGLKKSRGEHLVFLDADDRLLPEALQIGVDSLREHADCAFASGHCRLIVADGSLLATPEQAEVSNDHYLALLRRNYIWCPGSVIYRRSTFDIVGGFDPSLGPGADYDLYLRIARALPVFSHNRFVVDYRLHKSMSSNHSLMLREALKALESQWNFLKASPSHVAAFKSGRRYWQDYYHSLEMSDKILETVEVYLPPHAMVAVATGGKRDFLKLGGLCARHFPQAKSDGRGRLFRQGPKGFAEVPWIEAGMQYEFRLFRGEKYSEEVAAVSVTGSVDTKSTINADPTPENQAYLIASPNPVPTPNRFGRTAISWNTGDGSEGRIYVSQGGDYDNRRPEDSDEAISHLEDIRAQGAEYLLLPATAFWWLDRYQKFRQHLEDRYQIIARDENTCLIFDLRQSPDSTVTKK